MDSQPFLPLMVAIVGLVIGFSGEGNNDKNPTPSQKFCKIIKWISIIVIAIYVLVLVAVLTDGIGLPCVCGPPGAPGARASLWLAAPQLSD